MLCEAKCDAGDQIDCLKQLEILDFGLALASRQGLPVLKRTKRCVFFVGFLCFFDFCVGWRSRVGQTVFILFGACNSNPFSPHDRKTPKTVMQSVMQCGIICWEERTDYDQDTNSQRIGRIVVARFQNGRFDARHAR